MTNSQLRHAIYRATAMASLLPPLVGGTLMTIAGIYPFPQLYLVFTSYTLPYVLAASLAIVLLARKVIGLVTGLTALEADAANDKARRILRRLPFYLFTIITIYSIFGALSTNVSLEHMGYMQFDLRAHLITMFGLIPVVLITVFPIFFYLEGQLGLYLGQHGIQVVAMPIRVKLFMLGLVTPVLIGSLLVAYYYEKTGVFGVDTVLIWGMLIVIAATGTWIAWRSFKQSMAPLETFLASHAGNLLDSSEGLMPTSMDELGALAKNLRKLLQVAKRQEKSYRALYESMNDAFVRVDMAGRILEYNQCYREMLGYQPDELQQFTYQQLTPEKWREEEARIVAMQILPRGYSDVYEKEYIRKDGTTFPVELRTFLLRDEDGKPSGMWAIVRDVSERVSAEKDLRLMASVFQNTDEATLITDADNNIVRVNRAFTLLTGYTEEEVTGKNPKLLSAGMTSSEEYRLMWEALRLSGSWHGEVWDKRKDGTIYPKWLSITAVKDDQGKIQYHIATFTNISERKEAQQRIEHLAHHDSLTGLSNRFSFEARLEQVLVSAQRNQFELAVMFLDLDRFKNVNDSLGHHAGDALLVEVANRLKACVRESDIVARLGGDEFVIVLLEPGDKANVAEIAKKIVAAVQQPFVFDEHAIHSSTSIGICMFPENGAEVGTLMKKGDTAMYHAKSQGRNNYQFFSLEMETRQSERLWVENELRLAIEKDEFVLHFQPIVKAEDGMPAAVEALIRWNKPGIGMVPPDRFIPVAEETGLILGIGAWVTRQACLTVKHWANEGVHIEMAINVSARQLSQPDFTLGIATILRETDIDPAQLKLEVTESFAMDNPERTIYVLHGLRGVGVKIAIDDFGTGFTSLSYLKLFPVDCLKIDRSFVKDILTDANDKMIASSIIALSHSLGLYVVAEGVETQEQHDWLSSQGCDQMQGYLFSRPLPTNEALNYLKAALH